MKKFRFNAVQKEWLARVVMVAVFVGLPMLADAAPTEDANISKIGKTITNIVMTLIATAVLAVGLIRCGMLGITYMAKPENERGEEDAKHLKAGIQRIIVGAAIALGADIIVGFVVKALVF